MSLPEVFVQGPEMKIQHKTLTGYCGGKIQLFHNFTPLSPARSINKYIKFEITFQNIFNYLSYHQQWRKVSFMILLA